MMMERPKADPHPELSDELLVTRTLDGDRSAYSILIQRYWRMVFSLAYRGCRNVTDAEDITQESFLAALGSLSKLKDLSKFSSWLYGLTLNTTRSFLRKKSRTPTLPEPPVETSDESIPTTLQNMESDERHSALLRAVDSLKPLYRVVVEMRYVQGLSCEEIAERLGEPSGTVRSRLCRASEILRRKMQKHS